MVSATHFKRGRHLLRRPSLTAGASPRPTGAVKFYRILCRRHSFPLALGAWPFWTERKKMPSPTLAVKLGSKLWNDKRRAGDGRALRLPFSLPLRNRGGSQRLTEGLALRIVGTNRAMKKASLTACLF